MNPFALASRFTVCWIVALIATADAAVSAEKSADSAFRLVLPDGPFEQWKTITFDVDPLLAAGREVGVPNSADVELTITSPSGARLAIPAFPALADTSNGHLRCRFTPREAGKFSAEVTIADSKAGETIHFQVAPALGGRGFLSVDRSQPYFFQFDNGEQFRGIGTNLGWEPRRRKRAEHTYDALFPKIAANGLNTIRTWICPWNMSPDWNASPLGTYDPNGLKRLDEMLALAEENGIYVVLVLGYHGELQTESGAFPGNDRWKENPYNVANDGPCETPADFFTSNEAKELYKQRLRLLVARIASHPHLLAWEFWNEIDHIEKRGPVPGDALVAWHKEMAQYLRAIDPCDHPITTSISVKAPTGLWELDNLDLIMLHPYGKTDKLANLLESTTRRYLKPTIAGEFSYSWQPAKASESDDFERELKLGLWRGLMSPTPILPMSWWWEYHDSRNDWRYYKPIARCLNMMTSVKSSDWAPIAPKVDGDSVECRGIRVGDRLFVWIHNHSHTSASNLNVLIPFASSHDYAATTFSTVTGEAVHEDSVVRSKDGTALIVKIPLLEGDQETLVLLK